MSALDAVCHEKSIIDTTTPRNNFEDKEYNPNEDDDNDSDYLLEESDSDDNDGG